MSTLAEVSTSARLGNAGQRPMRADLGQYCTFTLDGHLFGVPVGTVQEVLRTQAVTPVPLAAAEVSGLINLRGHIVPTVELRQRLGLPVRPPGHRSVFVVVRTAEGHVVSLVVDEIGDVLEPDRASFEPPPETLPQSIRDLVTGVCKLDGCLLLQLDTELATTVGGTAA
jgi:purine-binding chemotaxis protein CheW